MNSVGKKRDPEKTDSGPSGKKQVVRKNGQPGAIEEWTLFMSIAKVAIDKELAPLDALDREDADNAAEAALEAGFASRSTLSDGYPGNPPHLEDRILHAPEANRLPLWLGTLPNVSPCFRQASSR